MKTEEPDWLSDLRKQLDTVDNDIVHLLEKRFEITDKVALNKDKNNIPITDSGRERAIMDRIRSMTSHPILKEHITEIYEKIIELNKAARIFKKEKHLPFTRIGVVGLGMIGGSIVKGLRMKDPDTKIYTVTRDNPDIALARKQGYLDGEFETVEKMAESVQLIVIATPIDTVADVARKMIDGTNLTVIDVSSVKERISLVFDQLTAESGGQVQFVPSHPMAGSEKTGFASAQGMLFSGKPWVVTPHSQNTPEAVANVEQFVRYMGSPVVTIPADEHDREVAQISHLIFLLSCYMFSYAHAEHPQALKIAGSGLQSLTRLASGSVVMHTSIVKENYENITVALVEFIRFIKDQSLDDESVRTMFSETKEARDAYMAKQKE